MNLNLMWVSSANQYAKNRLLQTQWNLKKQSGDFTGHKKSLRDYISINSSAHHEPEPEDHKLSAILAKATAGKKLSMAELEYVKSKNPMLYEQLLQAEQEQKDYEEALRRCKTKDEAQRLHVFKLAEIMTAAKNGDQSAIYRLNRLTATMTAFTQSEEYHKMPTEAEQAIEREAVRKAEQEELAEQIEQDKEAEQAQEAETESTTEQSGADEQTEEVRPDEQSEPSGQKRKYELRPAVESKQEYKFKPVLPGENTVPQAARKTVPSGKYASADTSALANKGVSAEHDAPLSGQNGFYMKQWEKKSRRRTFDARI